MAKEEAESEAKEEEERIAQQEAEQKEKEESAKSTKSAKSNNSTKSTKSTKSNNSGSKAVATSETTPSSPPQNSGGGGGGGTFIMPSAGGVTSEYGWRTHPIHGGTKLHAGMDIGVGIGSSVKAAASGVVSTVGSMGGYGNVVIISHSINGKSYTTLYAHLNSQSVSVGQSVSQGQEIAKSGNTGASTGPHLHFEIHQGGYGNPVNPRNHM